MISGEHYKRVWIAHGLQPHRVRTFKLSRDPHFQGKLEDVVGLYLHPPEHAVVLCVDEKSQIQARPGSHAAGRAPEARALRNDDARLQVAWQHHHFCRPACRGGLHHLHVPPAPSAQEWLTFLLLIDRQTPQRKALHLIADNYATHKHPTVQRWLARHPRIHMHFTPTSGL